MKRLVELDVCRGLAAFSVLLFHYTTRYNQLYGHSSAMGVYFPLGYLGVDFFFILSGFVIFMTVDKVKSRYEFFSKRLARIFPAYWMGVLVTFVAVTLLPLPGRSDTAIQALANLILYHVAFKIPSVDGVYWSLQLEVALYVIAGLIAVPKRLETKYLCVGAIASGLVPLAYRVLEHKLPHAAGSAVHFESFGALFAVGALIYSYKKRTDDRKMLMNTLIAMLVLAVIAEPTTLMPAAWYDPVLLHVRPLRGVLEAGFVGMFFLMLDGRMAWMSARPLVFLGAVSYPLYLVHQNIGYIVIQHGYKLGLHPYLSIALAAAVSIAIAAAMTFLYEAKARKIMLDFLLKRAPAVPGGVPATETT